MPGCWWSGWTDRWEGRVPAEIRKRLFALQDLPYRDFTSKLIPTVPGEQVIGVRVPALRALARELRGTPEAEAFLAALPHIYLEENNLHGFLISELRDYDQTISRLDAFLPHVDNWATCDLISPRAFKKHPEALYPGQIAQWLKSPHPYTVRFGVGMLLGLYLDEHFKPEMLEVAAGIVSDAYYVNMMVAWYFATALAKQWEASFPYLSERRLPAWTHNKTIQKAVESRRISQEQKALLKTLRP